MRGRGPPQVVDEVAAAKNAGTPPLRLHLTTRYAKEVSPIASAQRAVVCFARRAELPENAKPKRATSAARFLQQKKRSFTLKSPIYLKKHKKLQKISQTLLTSALFYAKVCSFPRNSRKQRRCDRAWRKFRRIPKGCRRCKAAVPPNLSGKRTEQTAYIVCAIFYFWSCLVWGSLFFYFGGKNKCKKHYSRSLRPSTRT